jgi:hypothetical protein
MSLSRRGSRSSEGVRVSMDDLRKKLGLGGYHLWTLLVGLANAEGLVTLSTAEMRRARGLTPKQAEKGLARLREAKLLRSLGWRTMEVAPAYGAPVKRRVFARQVRGRILDPLTARVPVVTWRWLGVANAWGGAREGAGKRARAGAPAPFQEGASSFSRGGQRGGLGSPRRGDPLGGVFHSLTRNVPSDLPSVDPKVVRRDRVALPDSVPGLDLGGELGQAPDVNDDRPRHITVQDLYRHSSVPARPRIRTPAVPPPPQLDPSAKPVEHARILARLYTTAIEKRYGTRIWTFSKGVERSRYRKLLESTAATLIDKEIPPGQWVRWRLEQVLDQTRHWKTKHPPVNTIFSKKSLDKDRWKYRAFGEDATLSAHRQILGKAHKQLVHRWARMERALLHEVPRHGLEAVPAIVARFFPDGLYDQLHEAAEAESVELSTSLRQRAASGEYLW